MDISRISYVSDLHLDVLCDNKNLQGEDRVDYVCQLAECVVNESNPILLFAGDYSDDNTLFDHFLERFSEAISSSNKKITPIFVLGNHDYKRTDDISTTELLEKHNMCFLMDELLIVNGDDSLIRIPCEDSSVHQILYDVNLKNAKLIIIGVFDALYYWQSTTWISFQRTLAEHLKGVPVIVLNHYPVPESSRVKGWIYVWGHTHKDQECQDDGINRIYADNQWAGQYSQHIKSFQLNYRESKYLLPDGITTISKEQYQDIFRDITSNPINVPKKYIKIHALKSEQLYCFIGETTKGYCVLNGGSGKSLKPNQPLQFFYDHLKEKAAQLQQLDSTISSKCKRIISVLKSADGAAVLHGSIIDYDKWHHVFFDPESENITCYRSLGLKAGYKGNLQNFTVYGSFESFFDAIEDARRWMNRLHRSINAIEINDSLKSLAKTLPYSPTLRDDYLTVSLEAALIQKISLGIVAIWDTQFFD